MELVPSAKCEGCCFLNRAGGTLDRDPGTFQWETQKSDPMWKKDKSFLKEKGDAKYRKASPDKKCPKMGLFCEFRNREQDLLGREQCGMSPKSPASIGCTEGLHGGEEIRHRSFGPDE